ncbi:MAG: hypothetical protein WDA26_03575, partial [Pusillimonas sp.]
MAELCGTLLVSLILTQLLFMRKLEKTMAGHVLGIVGATGAVGQKILKVIDERVKNIKALRLFASARSAKQKIA